MGFAARRENLPPEQARALGQTNRGALRKPGPGEGNNGIGQVFEQRIFGDDDFVNLKCGRSAGSRPVDSRASGGGELNVCVPAQVHTKGERVAAQHASRYVMQMRERRAVFPIERPDHPQRRLLLAADKKRATRCGIAFEVEAERTAEPAGLTAGRLAFAGMDFCCDSGSHAFPLRPEFS
jgi:hypothetical protein